MIEKLSRDLRSLIKSGSGRKAPQGMDVATLGLMGRVREEWELRQRTRVAGPFALPDLLRSLDRARSTKSHDSAPDQHERRPNRLPARSLGRYGPSRPVDDAFFARREYSAEQLTDFADAVFVEIAYRCVLKRPPDPIGFSGFLRPLREGDREPIDVLHALRTSPEGKQQGVAIAGLRTRVFWRRSERIPLIGPIVGWVHALADLRRIARRLTMLETRADASQQELTRQVDALAESEPGRDGDAIVALQRSQVRVETAVVGLADRYRRFLVEVEAREAARRPAREAADAVEPRQ